MSEATNRIVQQLTERIRPHLEECGVQGFVMIALVGEGDGTVRRVAFEGRAPGSPEEMGELLGYPRRVGILWSAGKL